MKVIRDGDPVEECCMAVREDAQIVVRQLVEDLVRAARDELYSDVARRAFGEASTWASKALQRLGG